MSKDELKKCLRRAENNISVFHEIKTAKEYLEKIRVNLELDDVIEIIDSCHFNYFENFCPVLIRLGPNYVVLDDKAESKFYPYEPPID